MAEFAEQLGQPAAELRRPCRRARKRASRASSIRRTAGSSTCSMAPTAPTPRCARTRSSRSACRTRRCRRRAQAAVVARRRSRAADLLRAALARARPSATTDRTIRAACGSATAGITRDRYGRGCWGITRSPNSACTATPPRRSARLAPLARPPARCRAGHGQRNIRRRARRIGRAAAPSQAWSVACTLEAGGGWSERALRRRCRPADPKPRPVRAARVAA